MESENGGCLAPSKRRDEVASAPERRRESHPQPEPAEFSGHEAVRLRQDGLHVWAVERLWVLAAKLTPERVPLSELEHLLDMDGWFLGDVPTVRGVAEHARRIYTADCSYPVLLAADGSVFDGLHRIARAYLEGHLYVPAVRFPVDPAPDRVEVLAAGGGAPGS